MRVFFLFLIIISTCSYSTAQSEKTNRTTMYMTYGKTGANLREFNQMLENKGLSPMRNGYSNLSFGYLTRFNDFILGVELFHNGGLKSNFGDFEIDYQSSRFYVNVGFAFTEEGNFQLIHYMSFGSGFANFQMLKENDSNTLNGFLQNPENGYLLRKGNLHKSTLNMSGFLTEIGFQMSYDLPIPTREEALEIIARFGYSFSPFEDSWDMNGINFNSIQSGAFFRLGVGISLPDHNYFYKDASLGAHMIYGMPFTKPNELNKKLEENGLNGFGGRPNNWGLKVLGESKGFLYGFDFYNLGMSGQANESKSHTLNSLRLYANVGLKLFERRNLELGTLGGLGFANIRYSLTSNEKPDFPRLFEEPFHDGYLRNAGIMAKPELYLAYGLPILGGSSRLMFSIHGGYELPLSNYRLEELSMFSYMANPYLQFGIGIRP